MKVWIVNQYALTPDMAGPTRQFSFAKELSRRGHDVTVIGTSFNHYTHREMKLADGERFTWETIDGVRFIWLRTSPYSGNTIARIRNMMEFSIRLWAGAFAQVLEPPDAIVGSSPHLFGAFAAQRLAQRYDVPFVLEIRDLWPETLVALGDVSRRHPTVWMLERLEKFLYARADRILTLLPGASEHIRAKSPGVKDVVWIPNGIDLEMVPQAEPPTPSNRFTIMYAGTLGFANKLDLILEAAGILQRRYSETELIFRFVGDGPERSRLTNKAVQLGLTNVHFDGPVPKSQIYETLKGADCLVIVVGGSPLYQWGISPNKLFDYLAAGRPIVFSGNVPFNPVEKMRAGVLTDPDDAESLASGIETVIQMSPGERWKMGLQGRRYVEQYHAISVLGTRFEEVLNEVHRLST